MEKAGGYRKIYDIREFHVKGRFAMDFTNDEQERINFLYGNDFEDITPDDAKLICRWEAWKATEEAKNSAEMEALKSRTEAKISEFEKQSAEASALLRELRDKARERFERLSNEQAK